MKSKIQILALMLVGIMLSVNQVWGAGEQTATLSISSGFTKNGNLNDDQSQTWAISSDGAYTSNNSYIQVGTNNSAVTYLKLSTSAYAAKSISKIQVWGTSKASTNVTAKISIDGHQIGVSSSAYSTQNASSGGTELSATNTKGYSGDILIEISRPSSAKGAIYFNKLIVTYADGAGSTYTLVILAQQFRPISPRASHHAKRPHDTYNAINFTSHNVKDHFALFQCSVTLFFIYIRMSV